MTLVIEATYEDGVLKPTAPLPLKEHEKVRITLESEASAILTAHGILEWIGSAQTLERFALDPEFDPQDEG